MLILSIVADKNQIEQVILNLLLNSKEAIKSSGEIKISLKSIIIERSRKYGFKKVEPGSYVELSITDTGVGISKENIDKIFEPFWTSKETGTGLGLAIVYSIIEQSKGYIKVESKENVGTLINILFKEVHSNSEAIDNPHLGPMISNELHNISANYSSANENYQFRIHEVLVVDDNELVRDMLDKVLRKNDFKIHVAKSPSEANLLFQENNIELLITDIIMPQMNGLELVEVLKSKKPELKVIFITGYDKYQTDFNTKDIVIQKPFLAEDLLKAISKI